eukprot:scaffold1021_cov241-Pinguiococcus_pyrenoidosus.AAC.11
MNAPKLPNPGWNVEVRGVPLDVKRLRRRVQESPVRRDYGRHWSIEALSQVQRKERFGLHAELESRLRAAGAEERLDLQKPRHGLPASCVASLGPDLHLDHAVPVLRLFQRHLLVAQTFQGHRERETGPRPRDLLHGQVLQLLLVDPHCEERRRGLQKPHAAAHAADLSATGGLRLDGHGHGFFPHLRLGHHLFLGLSFRQEAAQRVEVVSQGRSILVAELVVVRRRVCVGIQDESAKVHYLRRSGEVALLGLAVVHEHGDARRLRGRARALHHIRVHVSMLQRSGRQVHALSAREAAVNVGTPACGRHSSIRMVSHVVSLWIGSPRRSRVV